MKHSKVPAQSDREPVDDLDNRDKAVILGDLKKKLIAIYFYTDTVCGVCDKYEVWMSKQK